METSDKLKVASGEKMPPYVCIHGVLKGRTVTSQDGFKWNLRNLCCMGEMWIIAIVLQTDDGNWIVEKYFKTTGPVD